MTRVYSSRTGAYLGITWYRFGCWYSEDRNAVTTRHATETEAMARLERQPEHQATIEITLEEVAAINELFDRAIQSVPNGFVSTPRLSCALSILDITLCRGMALLTDGMNLIDVELPDRWDKD